MPARFVWRTDADGAFSTISPEFAAVVGEQAADVIGRRFSDVAAAFGLDPSGEITQLLERRDTWSGRSVLWPVAGTDLKIPVDLAALPVYGRSRAFEGFRGFGVARGADAVVDPEGLGMALVLLVKFVLTMPNLYPWQRDVHRSQPGFEAEVPRGMRIGSFNAGIPNYFGGREVINLDGLVNHTVIPYWREGRFEAYLRDAGIAYIADENESLSRARSFSPAPFTLVPVDSVELTGWSSRYRRLWKVEGGEMEDGR